MATPTLANPHEQAELLLWDFAKRAQQEEDSAYRRYQKFIAASEQLLDAGFRQPARPTLEDALHGFPDVNTYYAYQAGN